MALIPHLGYNNWLPAVNRSHGTQNVLDIHVVTVYSNIFQLKMKFCLSVYTRFSYLFPCIPCNLVLTFRLKMKAYKCTSEGYIQLQCMRKQNIEYTVIIKKTKYKKNTIVTMILTFRSWRQFESLVLPNTRIFTAIVVPWSCLLLLLYPKTSFHSCSLLP